VFSNLLVGKDSFAALLCNGNVSSESLLSNGRLALAPVFRLPAVTSQYQLHNHDNITLMLSRFSTDSATGYGLDSRGSNPGRGNICLLSTVSRLALGPTHPPIQCVQRIKRSQREADGLPPSRARQRIVDLCIHSPICFHGTMLN
jgi:hypothetical protein